MPRQFLLLATAILLSAFPVAYAAEKTGADSQDADIRKVITALEESFNRGDAKSLAASWTADGEFVGPRGEVIDGHEKIEAAFREFLATHKNSKLRLAITSWRQVGDDMALVDLLSEMTPAPEGLEAEPTSNVVLVKREGHWMIASMRESAATGPSQRVRLKSLQWMIGDWTAENRSESGVSVHSACNWTSNRSYIIRKFTAERQKGLLLAGTEVIGWDPRNHRIRSWTFDSDGGFGESIWTRDGDRWIVKYTGTLADGSDVSATRVVTLVDADTLAIQSKDRITNGEKQPDLPEIKLKRRFAPPETKSIPSDPATPPRHVLP